MDIRTIRTEGLGDSTYVVTHGDIALVVDPQRDIDRFETVLNESGCELRFVLETHLHNDYISGGRHLASGLGGELVMPAGAAPVFRHRPAFHREDLAADGLAVRPIHTPGHTPEHMSYLILIEGQEVALFSGGSLLVGSAGRTDLLGSERAGTLARLQYGSVRRLAELTPQVGLYPTHGSGSFCTSSGTGELTSTIGVEVRTNPVLAYDDEDSFVEGQLSGLVPYPAYYAHMGPANLIGSPPAPEYTTPVIGEAELNDLSEDVVIVDARPPEEYAAGHIPGSVGIPMRDDFGVWAGWVLPFQVPLILVVSRKEDVQEARRQLARIGFDDVRGVVEGLGDWTGELAAYETATPRQLARAVADGAQVLDVRAPDEWESGTIPGSELIYAPDVASGATDGLQHDAAVWVACGSGFRATIAASFLEKEGFEPVVVTPGGVTEAIPELSKV